MRNRITAPIFIVALYQRQICEIYLFRITSVSICCSRVFLLRNSWIVRVIFFRKGNLLESQPSWSVVMEANHMDIHFILHSNECIARR